MAPPIRFWISSSKVWRLGYPLFSKSIALQLQWVAVKGCDLDKELLVEQSQLFLLLEDVLAIERHVFPFVV